MISNIWIKLLKYSDSISICSLGRLLLLRERGGSRIPRPSGWGWRASVSNLVIDQLTWPDLNAPAPRMPRSLLRVRRRCFTWSCHVLRSLFASRSNELRTQLICADGQIRLRSVKSFLHARPRFLNYAAFSRINFIGDKITHPRQPTCHDFSSFPWIIKGANRSSIDPTIELYELQLWSSWECSPKYSLQLTQHELNDLVSCYSILHWGYAHPGQYFPPSNSVRCRYYR